MINADKTVEFTSGDESIDFNENVIVGQIKIGEI